jgi:hypothetical protein
MGYKVRRTEHAGMLHGSDGQKEHDDRALLKQDSNKRRREWGKRILREAATDGE